MNAFLTFIVIFIFGLLKHSLINHQTQRKKVFFENLTLNKINDNKYNDE